MQKVLAKEMQPTLTAEICPQQFYPDFFVSRRALITVLTMALLVGFSLRVMDLNVESLGEDELNKLQTVAEYRANGLTGSNGEHPFLMKGLQLLSVSAAEKLNRTTFGYAADLHISEESALRFPTVLFGTFSALLLFFLFKELFGSHIGLITAVLWSVDPNAIGFNRIAKEDSFLLFFFLLANCFWLISQSRAEKGCEKWHKYIWFSALAYSAMMASKYMPHLLGIGAAYYNIFQGLPTTKWRLGKYRWLMFLVIIGIGFIVLNPTILLPETWQHMLAFSSEKRIGHDSYEFMGELFPNKMSLWFSGVPWTFYFVFILVKTPILTLIFSLMGLLLLFKRKLGDGRFFIFFWLLMWFLPFSVLGGKFMRYFTLAQPLILVLAALGSFTFSIWLTEKFFTKSISINIRYYLVWVLPILIVFSSLIASSSVAPHFRLYTNSIGGGEKNAGFYFPHDEFYDASTEEAVAAIIKRARPNALIANETDYLYEYYFRKAGRYDLVSVALSDKAKVAELAPGDFIVAAKGRRYFSNQPYLEYLESSVVPFAEIMIGEIDSIKIYQLDDTSELHIRRLSE